MPITLTPKEKQELEGQGFTYAFLKNVVQHRRSYWDPKTNTWTAPLPGDALRLAYYLRKGLMLEKPPDSPHQEAIIAPPESGVFVCPECGFTAKDKAGLSIHNRARHNPKRHHKKSKKGGR